MMLNGKDGKKRKIQSEIREKILGMIRLLNKLQMKLHKTLKKY